MDRRIVIDTDIGTDVDDLWTLAMVPGLEGVALEAVTVVYGDTDLRARLAALACRRMGLDVPVHRGCGVPISGKPVMWAGHEGEGVDGLDEAAFSEVGAVDALIDLAAASPGDLEIVAVGPLTNVATALVRDPAFGANVGRLTIMGGEMAHGWPEHNLSSDVDATATVLASGIPTTIVPLDQTMRVQLDRFDTGAIAAVHPIGALMADQAERFWAWLRTVHPASTGGSSAAHDPLALLAATEPAIFTTTPMALAVSPDGRLRGSADDASPIAVVTDLDPERARARILACMGVSSTDT